MMNRVAIVSDGSDSFPRLHRALPLCEIQVEAVCDLSVSGHERHNVDRIVHTMGITERDRHKNFTNFLHRMQGSHLLIDIGSQSKLQIYDAIKEALMQGINIAVPQPSAPFSALPTHQVAKLFAIGKKTGGRLLATSRLLFSKAFAELVRQINTDPHFGNVADIRCLYRCGIIPFRNTQARVFMIGRSGTPAFHVIFALMKTAPQVIVVVEKNNENYPPVYAVTLQFPQGTIANCMFTASRNWGDRYNQIDVGGTAGASFESDFLTWSTMSRDKPFRRSPIINDDDETGTIAGAAGKLFALFTPVNQDAHDAIVLRTFALRDALYEVLQKNDVSTTYTTTVTMKQIHRIQRKILNTKASSANQRIAAKIRTDDFGGAIQEALEAHNGNCN